MCQTLPSPNPIPNDDASLGAPQISGVPEERFVLWGEAVAAKLEKFNDAGGSQILRLSDAGKFTFFEWEQYRMVLVLQRLL